MGCDGKTVAMPGQRVRGFPAIRSYPVQERYGFVWIWPGLDVPSSCEQSVCGTCLTGVKSGTPLHRDHYLTTEEQQANDQFLPCCSRAKSARLVLDL